MKNKRMIIALKPRSMGELAGGIYFFLNTCSKAFPAEEIFKSPWTTKKAMA